jgi:hypothetical protein
MRLALLTVLLVAFACSDSDQSESDDAPSSEESPSESAEPLRLTGGEAAELARQRWLADRYAQLGNNAESGRLAAELQTRIACDAEDFNEGTRNWIVLCTIELDAGDTTQFRWRVHDGTGEITEVQ